MTKHAIPDDSIDSAKEMKEKVESRIRSMEPDQLYELQNLIDKWRPIARSLHGFDGESDALNKHVLNLHNRPTRNVLEFFKEVFLEDDAELTFRMLGEYNLRAKAYRTEILPLLMEIAKETGSCLNVASLVKKYLQDEKRECKFLCSTVLTVIRERRWELSKMHLALDDIAAALTKS